MSRMIPSESLRSAFLQRRMDRAGKAMHKEMLAESHRPDLVKFYSQPEVLDDLLARAAERMRCGFSAINDLNV
jgi:hypothetical protein